MILKIKDRIQEYRKSTTCSLQFEDKVHHCNCMRGAMNARKSAASQKCFPPNLFMLYTHLSHLFCKRNVGFFSIYIMKEKTNMLADARTVLYPLVIK